MHAAIKKNPGADNRHFFDADQGVRARLMYVDRMAGHDKKREDTVRLFLAGDVMLGRGIDQILPSPCDPRLHEGYVSSAIEYVELAETRSGPIPRPASFEHVWGVLLDDLDQRGCDLRVINLETAITSDGWPVPKGINYRVSPDNARVLRTAKIDACTLANNHVLDWSESGLFDTLDTLRKLGIGFTGAGRNDAEAAVPLVSDIDGRGRVLTVAFGDWSSGIPENWRAAPRRPGVNMLPHEASRAVEIVTSQVDPIRRENDVLIVSVHWGDNWGYEVPDRHRSIAHTLIDAAGVDLVFGHSSHHPKGLEIYHGKLILFGCGDLINDYEGIRGHETYRPDLGVAYIADLDKRSGHLLSLEMIPYERSAFSLIHAGDAAADWLAEMLRRKSAPAKLPVTRSAAGSLRLDLTGATGSDSAPPPL